jgi:hypothetical protein
MLVLSPQELIEVTGKKRSYAQARELDAMGIPYKPRRNGSLCVYRIHVEVPLPGSVNIQAEPELQLDNL